MEEYGTRPNDAWRMAMADVDAAAATYALRKLIAEGKPFAPTLPEFAALCTRHRKATQVRPLEPPPDTPRIERKTLAAGLDRLRSELALPPRDPSKPTKL